MFLLIIKKTVSNTNITTQNLLSLLKLMIGEIFLVEMLFRQNVFFNLKITHHSKTNTIVAMLRI